MVNTCVTFTFPALPKLTFDLVIITKSFKSTLLEAAGDDDTVNLDDLAEDVYRKDARGILASFKSGLRSFGLDTTGDFFIIADRASVNVSAFGVRFLSCWPHQLDLSFKWALRSLTIPEGEGQCPTAF